MKLGTKTILHIIKVRTFFVLLGLVLAAEGVQAQTLKVRITVSSMSPHYVLVEGECAPTDTWSFRNVYGGITGLGERIDNFQVTGREGDSVSVRQLAPGEFRATSKVTQFRYEVRASRPVKPMEMSHISWLDQEHGFLMLADLLPQSGNNANHSSAVVEFNLPPGWTVASAARAADGKRYIVSKTKDAVFYVGRSLREKTVHVDSIELALISSGEWTFGDSDALNLASKVIKEYLKLTRYRLQGRSVVMLSPLPLSNSPARWTAETRGSTVVLLLGGNASRRVLLDRLGILFTHELLHLWVPNALQLEGDYDWFFEGFTVYQALLTALNLDFISFQDYLRTIARVYDSYRRLPDRDRLSLVGTSERRWTSSPSLVYDKGMLVAFIYDLMLRQTSLGKASLTDSYAQLFRPSRAERENANEVIMSILNSPQGMNQFSETYVRNPLEINLQTLLAPYGLRVQTSDSQTRINVNKELSAGQRSLLQSLGYKP